MGGELSINETLLKVDEKGPGEVKTKWPAMPLPLQGLRVLDLSRLLPGPVATMHLRDLGAEVIKLESPAKADYLRFLEPYVEGQNVGFNVLNRGKKSVVVAFETEAGRRLVQDLAARCDILVESFRAGYLRGFGLDYETLTEDHPQLIYCSITAYGQASSRAGHDLNCLALSGLSHALSPEHPAVPAVQLADLTCGLSASQAILAALYEREKTGRGRHLDVAMIDSAYHLVMLESASAKAGVDSFHAGMLDGSLPYYRYYRCGDGRYIAVGSVEDKFQSRLQEALDLDDWDRAEEVFLTRPRSEWMEVLGPLDACVEPVLDHQETLTADWFRSRFPDPTTLPPALHQASFGGVPSSCAPPGQDTLEVLRLEEKVAQELLEAGVIVAC